MAEAESSATVDDLPSDKWNWKQHFEVMERHCGNFKVSCKYCQGEPITGGATRFRKHLLSSGGVRKCPGVPDDVVANIREISSKKDATVAARKHRIAEAQAADRERKRLSLHNLSQSLSTGTAHVNKKWKQSTLEECEGAAALDHAQAAAADLVMPKLDVAGMVDRMHDAGFQTSAPGFTKSGLGPSCDYCIDLAIRDGSHKEVEWSADLWIVLLFFQKKGRTVVAEFDGATYKKGDILQAMRPLRDYQVLNSAIAAKIPAYWKEFCPTVSLASSSAVDEDRSMQLVLVIPAGAMVRVSGRAEYEANEHLSAEELPEWQAEDMRADLIYWAHYCRVPHARKADTVERALRVAWFPGIVERSKTEYRLCSVCNDLRLVLAGIGLGMAGQGRFEEVEMDDAKLSPKMVALTGYVAVLTIVCVTTKTHELTLRSSELLRELDLAEVEATRSRRAWWPVKLRAAMRTLIWYCPGQ